MTKEEFMALPIWGKMALMNDPKAAAKIYKLFFLGQHTNPKRNAERRALRASKRNV